MQEAITRKGLLSTLSTKYSPLGFNSSYRIQRKDVLFLLQYKRSCGVKQAAEVFLQRDNPKHCTRDFWSEALNPGVFTLSKTSFNDDACFCMKGSTIFCSV